MPGDVGSDQVYLGIIVGWVRSIGRNVMRNRARPF
jgi:hypothetical protein